MSLRYHRPRFKYAPPAIGQPRGKLAKVDWADRRGAMARCV